MRRWIVCFCAMFVGPTWGSPGAFAQADREQSPSDRAVFRAAHLQPRQNVVPSGPISVHVNPRLPQPPAQQPAAQPPARQPSGPSGLDLRSERRQRDHRHHHHGGNGIGPFFWGGYPLVWSGGYAPAFAPFYPAAIDFAPLANFIPAPRPQAAANVPLGGAPAVRMPKPTSADQKAKAGKFIGFGDANFGNQKYLSAVERYKTAARMAPDLAEAYLRQGHALVALGQYESAVKAFRRGLKIRGDWTDSPFRLEQLYGQEALAKISHLENLAKAVEANPLDSDLLLALGMQLYFDGQEERPGVFFARAAQLGGNEDRLLDDFLPKPAPAGARQQPRGGGKIVF